MGALSRRLGGTGSGQSRCGLMAHRKPRANRRLTPIEEVDIGVARAVALDKRSKAGKALARFAELGDQPPLIALCLAVTATGALRKNEKLARTGLRMLAAHSLTTMAKLLGKDLVDRTRPQEALRNGRYRLEKGDSRDGQLRSLPSGHSAGVTAVALAASRDYSGLGFPAAVAGGTVMLAQLPAKNHFLSDIVAGAAIGLLAGLLAGALIPPFDRIRREPTLKRSRQT